MPQRIEVPGMGIVEFPDGMDDNAIAAAIQQNMPKVTPEQRQADALKAAQQQQMSEMSGPQKFAAGMGKAPMDLLRGAQQVAPMLPQVMDPFGLTAKILGKADQKEIDEAKRLEKPLLNTGAGTAGNIAGSVLTTLPAAFVPGANTVAGAGLVGAVGGALQPTSEGDSRLLNTGLGAAFGAGSQYGLGKLATAAEARLAAKQAESVSKQALNATKDEAIAEGVKAGYKTIPSVSNGSGIGKLLEGASGKTKAAQMASVENQSLTDKLARKAFGLADDVPLSRETMQSVRQEAAASGYAPVRAVGRMNTDDTFRSQISNITSRADNASKDFGALVKSDVKPFVDDLMKVKSFTGDAAVDQVAILRETASEAYNAGNKTLGKAYREAAEAIEAQIERGLARSGKDGATLIKDFRAARQTMAQTFDVEKGLREGMGSLDARALGKIFAKNPNKLTGDLRTIGKTAAAMPDVMRVPKDGWANPITALDSTGSAFASILSGSPLPLLVPAGRTAARSALLSNFGQKTFAPDYAVGAATKLSPKALKELEQLGLGGLLGAYVGQQ